VGPSDPAYAEHNRKNWKRYRKIPGLPPLNDAVWDSDMTHDSAIQASIAVLTAGIQDEPGKYDIYWTVTRHISRAVFEDVRDPADRNELLAMISKAKRELDAKGIKFDLEQFAWQYDDGIGAKLLEVHHQINQKVVDDAYIEDMEFMRERGKEPGFKPGPKYPQIYARKSPRYHFRESYPIPGTGMESMVERAVEETTQAEGRKFNLSRFLAGGQIDPNDVDPNSVTTKQFLAGTRERTRYYHVEPKIALPGKAHYFPGRVILPNESGLSPDAGKVLFVVRY